jgi:hypothetical protein
MKRYNVSQRKNTSSLLMAYKSDVLGVEQNQEKQSTTLVTQSTQLKSKEPISFLANYKNKRS